MYEHNINLTAWCPLPGQRDQSMKRTPLGGGPTTGSFEAKQLYLSSCKTRLEQKSNSTVGSKINLQKFN